MHRSTLYIFPIPIYIFIFYYSYIYTYPNFPIYSKLIKSNKQGRVLIINNYNYLLLIYSLSVISKRQSIFCKFYNILYSHASRGEA